MDFFYRQLSQAMKALYLLARGCAKCFSEHRYLVRTHPDMAQATALLHPKSDCPKDNRSGHAYDWKSINDKTLIAFPTLQAELKFFV